MSVAKQTLRNLLLGGSSAAVLLLLANVAQAQTAVPTGGQVVAGQATIESQGAGLLTITQSSDRAVVNWDDFSIGADGRVNFVQPTANAIALNRVVGANPSTILGSLDANGQVYLINPNGVLFGRGSQVNVGGLVATTADAANADFMAGGPLRFGGFGNATAGVVNEGAINVSGSGMAALVGPYVRNDGLIVARGGKIALGAAQAFTLDLAGDNLIRFQVGDEVTTPVGDGALVEAGGTLEGKSILLTAQAARSVVNQSVRITGFKAATDAVLNQDGTTSLVAQPQVDGARLTADHLTVTASNGEVQAGAGASLNLSGTATGGALDVTARSVLWDGDTTLKGGQTGGRATITGTDWTSLGGIIDVSGGTRGGTIGIRAGGLSLAGALIANSAGGTGGTIDIHATGRAIDSADSLVDATGLHGGAIRYVADDKIISSGGFRASGTAGAGGTIDITAARINLFGTRAYATGGIIGGTVRIGGEYQGGKTLSTDELANASSLVATDNTVIDVSATGQRGQGGTAILWSDDKTTFLGQVRAQGGLISGLGGFVEASSGGQLTWSGTVDTARAGLRGGTLLLDPKNITIAAAGSTSQYGLILQAFNSAAAPPLAGGVEANDFFATSISLDGTRLAVGAPFDDGAANIAHDSGAVYLFSFADNVFTTPVLQATLGKGYVGGKNLDVPGLESDDRFGSSVSLDGNRLAVGAIYDDGATNAASDTGAVYLFSFADSVFTTPTLQATLGKGYTGGKNLDVSGLDAGDWFGSSVSLDGTRLAVGAMYDGGPGNAAIGSGAVYLFSFADIAFTTPVLQATLGQGYVGGKNLAISALEDRDWFGVSVSLDGNRLAVGAYGDDGAGDAAALSGAVYLFSFADSAFSTPVLQATLGKGYAGGKNLDVPGQGANDFFGVSVSLDGTRLAVGAYEDDGAGNAASDTGAVYLFSFADGAFTTPILQATLGKGYTGGKNFDVSGLEAGDVFGSSVSLDGNRLAVGAYLDDGAANAVSNGGAVYLFSFADSLFTTPTLVSTIGQGYTNKSLDVSAVEANDDFGSSVSLDGNRLAVGAYLDDGAANVVTNSGAVYLFSFADSAFSTPVLQAILGKGYTGGKNLDVSALEAGDLFGSSVSLDGTRLAVGAYGDDGAANVATSSGAVYLFSFADSTFTTPVLQATLGKGYTGGKNFDVSALEVSDLFGVAVSLDGTRLAVGASFDDGAANAASNSGAVYLFSFADSLFTTPALQATLGKGYTGGKNLDVSGLEANDFFGSSVSLDGTRLAVGAAGDDGVGNAASNSGAVYLFSFADSAFSTPTLQATLGKGYTGGKNLDVSALEAFDYFGVAVSLDGTRLAVGASADEGAGNAAVNSGAVYLFSFADNTFTTPVLQATLGKGYTGGKNLDVSALEVDDGFGTSVSLDGTRLAVGATEDDGAANAADSSGAVYLFSFADSTFSTPVLRGTLGKGYVSNNLAVVTEGVAASDAFGVAVSLDGTRLAVGAYGDDGAANVASSSGAVYLFSFADSVFTTPTLQATLGKGYTGGKNLDVSALQVNDLFGSSVSLDGTRLAVGAQQDDGAGDAATDSGAVYLFSFADSVFTTPVLQATLGKGYAGGKNLDVLGLEAGDAFGSSVSLDGTRLAVGAYLDDGAANAATDSGAAYLFSFADGAFSTPTLQATLGKGYTGGKNLDVSGLEAGDWFAAVSLDGNRLAVGAEQDDGAGNAANGSGAVYLFSFADSAFSTPTLQATLGKGYTGGKNLDVSALGLFDNFGSSVSLDGTRLAAGAYRDDGVGNATTDSGAAYLFSFADSAFSTPVLQATLGKGYTGGRNLDVSGLAAGDSFGSSVSLDGNRLAVGAYADDGAGNALSNSGAVYLFDLGASSSAFTYSVSPASDVTITTSALTAILNAGTAVVLQASNDITLSDALTANNGAGNGGDLTLAAGRSLLINAAITSDNGNVTLIANDLAANGVVDAQRDAGAAAITFGSAGAIDAGAGAVSINLRTGAGNTNTTSGQITLGDITAATISVLNQGLTANSGITIASGKALTASGAGDAVVLSGADFINDAGAGAIDLTGGGRFLVYSTDWAADTRGGLAGGNLYNRTYAGNLPGTITQTGSRFIYSRQPTLTFAGVAANRAYGAANPTLSAAYASGLVNGDTQGQAFSGAAAAATTATTATGVGTATINVGLGSLASDIGYAFAYTPGTLTINQALLTVTATAQTKTYGAADPTLTYTAVGLVSGDSLTGALDRAAGTNVGVYAIGQNTLTAGGNYALTFVPAALTINQALLTVTADAKTKTYGAADPTLTYTAVGLVSGDSLTGALDRASGTNVGSYAIGQNTLTAGGNYALTFVPAALTITQALLTVTADDASRLTGHDNPVFTATIAGLVNGDTRSVVNGLSISSAATPDSAPGAYPIIASGATASNYTFTYAPGTLSVTTSVGLPPNALLQAAPAFRDPAPTSDNQPSSGPYGEPLTTEQAADSVVTKSYGVRFTVNAAYVSAPSADQ